MTKEDKLELLFEKLNAYKAMTVEAREFFKDEIELLVKQIKEVENEAQ